MDIDVPEKGQRSPTAVMEKEVNQKAKSVANKRRKMLACGNGRRPQAGAGDRGGDSSRPSLENDRGPF